MSIERVTGLRWPSCPPSNDERADAWREKYRRVPQEIRDAPVERHPRAVCVKKQKPEPLPVVVPIRRHG